jgi:hypothetical protein
MGLLGERFSLLTRAIIIVSDWPRDIVMGLAELKTRYHIKVV